MGRKRIRKIAKKRAQDAKNHKRRGKGIGVEGNEKTRSGSVGRSEWRSSELAGGSTEGKFWSQAGTTTAN